MTYSCTTRIQHSLVALTITFRLIDSLVMDHPEANRPMSQALVAFWHQFSGHGSIAKMFSWR